MSESRSSITNTMYRDAITLVLIGFIAIVIWMLPFLNPPSEAAKMDPPGSVIALITWPEGNSDVDIWIDGPGEPVPVGYSNKGGVLWNLLRDDLGDMPDYTPLNFENAFTRGMPPGAYRVNVQCFRCPMTPIEVMLEVSTKSSATNSLTLLASSTITLNKTTEEKTGLAFELDEDGNVVLGSMNTLFKPLRSGSK